MAETLFSKAVLLAKAGAHEFLDKGIDKLSIPVLKQQIRELEEASEDHSDALAIAGGQVQRLMTSVEEMIKESAQVNEDIDSFMSDEIPENDDLIEPLDQKLMGLEEELERTEKRFVDAKITRNALEVADRQIDKALTDRVRAVQEMEIANKAADAKDRAADALKKIGSLTTFNKSVDSITERIHQKSFTADARLKKALAGLGSDLDDKILAAKSRKRIAARRAKMNKQ